MKHLLLTLVTLTSCDASTAFRSYDVGGLSYLEQPPEPKERPSIVLKIRQTADTHTIHLVFSDGEAGYGSGQNAYDALDACGIAVHKLKSACVDYVDITSPDR